MANCYYNESTGKFNRSAIMRAAWARIKVRNQLKQRFAISLSIIWTYAKAEKEAVSLTQAQREARGLRGDHSHRTQRTPLTDGLCTNGCLAQSGGPVGGGIMERRDLLKAIPAAGVGTFLPTSAAATVMPDDEYRLDMLIEICNRSGASLDLLEVLTRNTAIAEFQRAITMTGLFKYQR